MEVDYFYTVLVYRDNSNQQLYLQITADKRGNMLAIYAPFLNFWGSNGLFLGWSKAHNLYLGGHHKAAKLLFPMLP